MIKHVTGQLEVLPGDGPIGLVVVPSRELCQQIAHVVSEHARYEPDKVIMSMVQADQDAQFVILAIRATENIGKKIVAVAASHSMRMNERGVYSLLMCVANVHRASASPELSRPELNGQIGCIIGRAPKVAGHAPRWRIKAAGEVIAVRAR